MKLCKHCKYYYYNRSSLCTHAKSVKSRSVVDNSCILTTCESMRHRGGACSTEGKLFQQKRVPKVMQWIKRHILLD